MITCWVIRKRQDVGGGAVLEIGMCLNILCCIKIIASNEYCTVQNWVEALLSWTRKTGCYWFPFCSYNKSDTFDSWALVLCFCCSEVGQGMARSFIQAITEVAPRPQPAELIWKPYREVDIICHFAVVKWCLSPFVACCHMIQNLHTPPAKSHSSIIKPK